MNMIVITFAVLILVAGIIIIINPAIIIGTLKKNINKLELHVLAVVVRVLLGALLIYLAGTTKYPVTIEVIGWISLLAAVIFTLIGRKKFIRLMSWSLSLVEPFCRIGGVLACCFGVFLIYAFI